MYCKLKSAAAVAHHFKTNESSVKTIAKRKKRKFMKPICCSYACRNENLALFVKYLFILY